MGGSTSPNDLEVGKLFRGSSSKSSRSGPRTGARRAAAIWLRSLQHFQPARPPRGRRIDNPALLRDDDLPRGDEPACGRPGRFHQRPPVGSADGPGGFGRADCLAGFSGRQQLQDHRFEPVADGRMLGPPARVAAVADVVPVAFPFLPPLDSAAAGGAGLFGSVAVHIATVAGALGWPLFSGGPQGRVPPGTWRTRPCGSPLRADSRIALATRAWVCNLIERLPAYNPADRSYRDVLPSRR
jgi:hypothetical protein